MTNVIPFPPHRALAVSRERLDRAMVEYRNAAMANMPMAELDRLSAKWRAGYDEVDRLQADAAKRLLFAEIAQGQLVPDDGGDAA